MNSSAEIRQSSSIWMYLCGVESSLRLRTKGKKIVRSVPFQGLRNEDLYTAVLFSFGGSLDYDWLIKEPDCL